MDDQPTTNPDENISDETLITACLAGDDTALNTLLERYYNPLKFYIYKHRLSWNTDESFIQEIISQTVVNVLQAIQSKRFTPSSIKLFKSYLFETCKRTCWEMNRKEKLQHRPASEVFTGESPHSVGIPEDIVAMRDTDTDDFDYFRQKFEKALPRLNDDEKRLLELRFIKGKTYKQIKDEDPVLGKYELDYLMLMMYIIKNKIREVK